MRRQLARFQSALAGGMPRRGWKVGINVPEVLQKARLHHPGVGWLNGSRVLQSGVVFSAPQRSRLHVEPEICLHVGTPLSISAGPEEVLTCVTGVSPALELINYALPAQGLDEIVEHNMLHAASIRGRYGSAAGRLSPIRWAA